MNGICTYRMERSRNQWSDLNIFRSQFNRDPKIQKHELTNGIHEALVKKEMQRKVVHRTTPLILNVDFEQSLLTM